MTIEVFGGIDYEKIREKLREEVSDLELAFLPLRNITFLHSDGERLYAVQRIQVNKDERVYVSDDLGYTWREVFKSTAIQRPYASRFGKGYFIPAGPDLYRSESPYGPFTKVFTAATTIVSIDEDSDGTYMFMSTDRAGDGKIHVYRSKDGISWSEIFSFDVATSGDRFLIANIIDSGRVYAFGRYDEAYYSTDLGDTWTKMSPVNPFHDVYAGAFYNGWLFIGGEYRLTRFQIGTEDNPVHQELFNHERFTELIGGRDKWGKPLVSPSGVLYLKTLCHLYASKDYGETFTSLLSWDSQLSDIEFLDGYIFLGTRSSYWHEMPPLGLSPTKAGYLIRFRELPPWKIPEPRYNAQYIAWNWEIRDTTDHYTDTENIMAVVATKKFRRVTLRFINSLDQDVSVQVQSDYRYDFPNPIDVGAAITVPAGGVDYATLTDLHGYLRLKVTAAAAPTTGNFTAIVEKGI